MLTPMLRRLLMKQLSKGPRDAPRRRKEECAGQSENRSPHLSHQGLETMTSIHLCNTDASTFCRGGRPCPTLRTAVSACLKEKGVIS